MSLRIFKSDEPNTFHYLTFITNRRVPIFCQDNACQIFVDVVKEIRQLHPFKLNGYVIMPDHVHMIINPLRPEISTILRKLKGKSAKLILDLLLDSNQLLMLKRLEISANDRRHAVWLTRSADIDLVSGRFFRQKLNYIHLNPVRAGLCRDPLSWKWSSYRAYLPGFNGEIPLDVDVPSHWTEKDLKTLR